MWFVQVNGNDTQQAMSPWEGKLFGTYGGQDAPKNHDLVRISHPLRLAKQGGVRNTSILLTSASFLGCLEIILTGGETLLLECKIESN